MADCKQCGGPKPKVRGKQYCDTCARERRKASKAKYRASGRYLELQRKRYHENAEEIRAYHRAWNRDDYRKHPEKYRRRNRENRIAKKLDEYGISRAEYEEMLDSGCAICGCMEESREKVNGKPYRLALDHCHATGELRGVLCSTCNTRLGWYENNRDEIEAYLP